MPLQGDLPEGHPNAVDSMPDEIPQQAGSQVRRIASHDKFRHVYFKVLPPAVAFLDYSHEKMS